MAVTLKFQSSGTMPGDAAPVPMRGASLTVGRGASNDMVLPDPDQMLSRHHCVIEDHNGSVVIVDLSSNGTFLNYSKIPLGRTPTPLNNGDVICIGNYELVIEIRDDLAEPDAGIAAPLEAAPMSPGVAENAPDPLALLDDAGPGRDFLDDLLGGSEPTGPSQLNPVDPIDELLPPMGEDEDPFFQKASDGREGEGASLPSHAPSAQDSFASPSTSSSALIPDDWDDDFLSGIEGPSEAPTPPADPAVAAPPAPAEDMSPAAPPAEDQQPDPAPARPPQHTAPEPIAPAPQPADAPPTDQTAAAATSDASGDQITAAFLEGLGAEEAALKGEDPATAMRRMGRVMHTLIAGLREILMTRTSIKSEFRIEQTMISAGGNNPLKFSITPEQAIETMLRPATKGYLSPETAAEEALQDIKAHEVAMVTGMEAALKGVLGRLDPKALEAQIEDKGGLGGILRGKKARYWDVYEQLYAEISDQAENDFHDLFSREFARAYKAQLDRLKD
ncbi:type VI secretion system-associated FHA domain protein TagH [Phaeobacter gallaeciensis]|uniref:type VI secretion system-associated FHA domain protein TagH n=1 Tax=Phaeobacter gallaeciensis TaxID=60890 RepID=UPI00237F4B27|nr:type VI secretion system-associated FHA domain protein TagH [Phaeobacter gallaeciensis]MDE4097166.1 type VI secretion system-associated FHA domain protein TagH [Phaeobacter gallaeciensis]MDE4106320.1 type VI secretion system-associated FHA domain protein TagH [Phaeobacter gallaeciensis]MDE4112918.1 type VI secretion system-associated FHA domain protein TagH [Phaeobacter gallaeciensis]MDE4114901.1 type VI secretion system-associated FHA domain protein TagH [Phaeobacter gallaeciensis]MDE41193